jgi:hypothetical protein
VDRDCKTNSDDDVENALMWCENKKKFWGTEVPELLFDR